MQCLDQHMGGFVVIYSNEMIGGCGLATGHA